VARPSTLHSVDRMSDSVRLLLCSIILCAGAASAQQVTDPSTHLGRPLGADFTLADWSEVSGYFTKLADESARVQTEVVGTTTEGRDFLLTTISSAANLAELDTIRANTAVLADPRGKSDAEKQAAIDDGRVVLFISCAMHATETAAPQMAMELAHTLATSDEEPWKTARDKIVVLIAPTLNPDGLDHVVSWYRETVGTPYEASGLLKLYQYYVGHDNNRDWFTLSQAETRIVTELLYKVWHPQIYWDVHQQGSTRERMFVPPFRDPLNPNLDPSIIAGIHLIGARALYDLTSAGFTGVSTGVSYDMWWNGGNRNVPVRHNIVGLLTEAASVRVATPIFLPIDELSAPRGLGDYVPSNRFPAPWPGGWWRIRNIIDYELEFARSLLATVAREPELWLSGALAAAERTIEKGAQEAPRAWIIPSDNHDVSAVRRLVEILMRSGIEVHKSTAELSADGRTWPAASLVVRRDQPYGSHVKDLFEVQRYPEGEPPYDVAGWTLPLLFGVHRIEAIEELNADLTLVTDVAAALARFNGDPRAATNEDAQSTSDSATWTTLVSLLKQETRLSLVTAGEREGLIVPTAALAETEPGRELGRMPRIGVYSPWRGNMDEGWLRYVLDTWEVDHVRVRNEMLRAGRLDDFLDVLLMPSISAGQLDRGRSAGSVPSDFSGGLAPEGAVAVEEFVRAGGRLITLGSSSQWAIDLFELPLKDVAARSADNEFTCPGSVLRAIPAAHAMTAGLPESVAVFFSRSSAWRAWNKEEQEAAQRDELPEVTTLLRYAPTRVLLSGWISKPTVIEDQSAWVRVPHGAGEVQLFGFRPQYRGWSQQAFGLLFRALFVPFAGEE
jgi:hypothetical protein